MSIDALRTKAPSVLHISSSNNEGGAARAAHRLHCGLRFLDCDSRMFVERKHGDDPAVIKFQAPMALADRVKRRFRRERIERSFARYARTRPAGLELFSDDRAPFAETVPALLPPCDLVNLHWVAGFVDYRSFFSRLPPDMPVVWTLHDMNPFTGGCHYDNGCQKFRSACGACPQLGSDKPHDLAYDVFNRKRDALRGLSSRRHCLVAASRWTATEAKVSALFKGLEVCVIPYGLDLEAFKPLDRVAVRTALGIAPDAKVVCFVSDHVSNPRKGFDLLSGALEQLDATDKLCLLVVGSRFEAPSARLRCVYVGRIASDRLLCAVYNAADVFVIPSRQEAFGQTALEAIACGVPVVGFDTGGIRDMVRSGETGLLARPESVQDLRDCIGKLLSDPGMRADMSGTCRRIALKEYGLEHQARRYFDLYRSLLSG